ncbi:MAG: hypothetical protein ABSF70_11210 [Terracidiphilus sp.]|jgi:hypothetical protein
MEPSFSPTAVRIDYEKQDFEDLVAFFYERKDIFGFLQQRISTNSDENLWIPDSRGWTNPKYREYFEGAPRILLAVAEIYRDRFREEGGRFWIDWYGARSIRDEEYFVRWIKSPELTIHVSQLRKIGQRHNTREFIIHMLTQPNI